MNMRKRILVITGVPGTGKTSFSNSLARKIPGAEVIHVTDVVNRKRLFSSRARDGSKIVNMPALQKELEKMVKESRSGTILLESHLLCDMRIRNASALVLREHLGVLTKRMKARGYGKGKIGSNVVSEATDYCGIHAERNYSRVFEALSGDKQLYVYARRLLDGKLPAGKAIDLLPEFYKLLRSKKGSQSLIA